MREPRRLLLYLLLNVIVSASVTGAILFWHDRAMRNVPQPSQPVAPAAATSAPVSAATPSSPLPTVNPDEPMPVEIVSVVGAGTLGSETVLIRYNGDGELDLTGWQLQNGDGDAYIFPTLKLYKNGAVQVHSGFGNDTVIDLYWGRTRTVWKSGELASLVDAQGSVRAIYRIP